MKYIAGILFGVLIFISCETRKKAEVNSSDSFQINLVEFYSNPDTTPLDQAEKQNFVGITFFPIQKKYKINANYQPIENGKVIPFPTSAGKIKHYKEFGLVKFTLDGKEQELTIYQSSPIQEAYQEHLFLPFTDDTNGVTTYGGGRYIDLSLQDLDLQNNMVIVDFNQAYNPYCAYSERYNCPIPPGNNSMDIEINAGVTYKK